MKPHSLDGGASINLDHIAFKPPNFYQSVQHHYVLSTKQDYGWSQDKMQWNMISSFDTVNHVRGKTIDQTIFIPTYSLYGLEKNQIYHHGKIRS